MHQKYCLLISLPRGLPNPRECFSVCESRMAGSPHTASPASSCPYFAPPSASAPCVAMTDSQLVGDSGERRCKSNGLEFATHVSMRQHGWRSKSQFVSSATAPQESQP
ncbi:hypothetical protein GQ53DRAFT_513332 [Thozetella sp. PMI_491]|nr:hypothetical protein GQ53DRAFT_513332 [Thozetella sp. PMI_491]